MDRLLRLCYAGVRARKHPYAPYQVHFDGYRNLGWTLGGLKDWESGDFSFAAEWLAAHPARCVWDVGANVGFWSLFFAGLRPKIEQVVCFEPDPSNLRLLTINKQRNALDALVIRQEALSDRVGNFTFMTDPLTGATGTLESGFDFIGRWYNRKQAPIEVPVTTIDTLVAEGLAPPQFLKIDVEGHELSLLRGGERTLREHRPPMLLEASVKQDLVGQLLHDLGYRLLDPGSGKEISLPQYSTAAVPR